MQIILQKQVDCAIKACVFVWVGGVMAGLSAIGMGGKGQTKTSKATGNVALEEKNETLFIGQTSVPGQR